jgi:cyclopropane fatty-acyl-phospholipid synthase-like methyltransferase
MTSVTGQPGDHLDATKMPGHWLLLRLGKRVLRPGGLKLTRQMLDGLNIQPDDDVVEFGPGLGVTARLTISRKPHSYVGIERDESAARIVRHYLKGFGGQCLIASADETGLANAQASVVYGEAMLTMQGQNQKVAIIAEAARLLRPGGRYGIHELCLVPDELPRKTRDLIEHDLTTTIHVGARPLTVPEWRALLTEHGFSITHCATVPMHLLEAPRLIQDEGLGRVLLIAGRLLRDREARARVFAIKNAFRKHGSHLRAITIVGRKP